MSQDCIRVGVLIAYWAIESESTHPPGSDGSGSITRYLFFSALPANLRSSEPCLRRFLTGVKGYDEGKWYYELPDMSVSKGFLGVPARTLEATWSYETPRLWLNRTSGHEWRKSGQYQ
ncbi:acetyl xylan esterase [Moniliophthora roreri]|nr:acetyl xylan esterase [Moniliophthora roreri]